MVTYIILKLFIHFLQGNINSLNHLYSVINNLFITCLKKQIIKIGNRQVGNMYDSCWRGCDIAHGR